MFSKSNFPAIFGGNLEFLHKIQKCIYLANDVRQSDFNKIFYPQGVHRVNWRFFPKIIFPPSHQNFCQNGSNSHHFQDKRYTDIQDGCQKWRENNFWERLADDLVDTLWVKIFCQIFFGHFVSDHFQKLMISRHLYNKPTCQI